MASAASLQSQEGDYIILTIVFSRLSEYVYGLLIQRYLCAIMMSDNSWGDTICGHFYRRTAMSPYHIIM